MLEFGGLAIFLRRIKIKATTIYDSQPSKFSENVGFVPASLRFETFAYFMWKTGLSGTTLWSYCRFGQFHPYVRQKPEISNQQRIGPLL